MDIKFWELFSGFWVWYMSPFKYPWGAGGWGIRVREDLVKNCIFQEFFFHFDRFFGEMGIFQEKKIVLPFFFEAIPPPPYLPILAKIWFWPFEGVWHEIRRTDVMPYALSINNKRLDRSCSLPTEKKKSSKPEREFFQLKLGFEEYTQRRK